MTKDFELFGILSRFEKRIRVEDYFISLDKMDEVPVSKLILLIYPVDLRSLGIQICEVLLTLFI